MTDTLPSDPECLNYHRVQLAASALRCFQDETGADNEALGDLLCDLMHWCDRNSSDF